MPMTYGEPFTHDLDVGLFLEWSRIIGRVGEEAWTKNNLLEGLSISGLMGGKERYLEKGTARQLVDLVYEVITTRGDQVQIVALEENEKGKLFISGERAREFPMEHYFREHSYTPPGGRPECRP